jgi:prevent-host-death family protein
MTLSRIPVIETLNVSEARKQFSELLNRVHRDEELIVIEKSGIPVAGIVPMSVVRFAREKEAHRQNFLQALDNIQSGFAGVSEEEAEREVEKALAEIRQERLLARRIVTTINRVQPDAFEASDDDLEGVVARILGEETRRRALATAQTGT